MKLENAKKVRTYLVGFGIACEISEGYSGRGMFGKTTAGVTVEDPGSVDLAMKTLEIDDTQRKDNMGFDYIVY